MRGEDRPDPPTRPELDFRGAASKARKRRKELKRRVARAARIEREGLGPRAVRCPRCGAPPFVSVKRDPGYCTTPGGLRSLGGPLPHHANHKAREEEAARQKTAIILAGEQAEEELRSEPR